MTRVTVEPGRDSSSRRLGPWRATRAANPSFIFADAPTSALDWENGQKVIELLTAAAQVRGATVLVVTHDPRLTPFADRVFDLADGMMQTDAESVSGHTPPHAKHGPRL